MELKEAFQGVLVKALNLPEAEVSSLFSEDGVLKDDALEVVLNKNSESVLKARDKAKADREEQYKRGLREKGTEYEKLLKDAGVEIGDEKGSEAVQKLKDHIAAQAKPSDLKDDAVKNSELYRKMEKQFQSQLTEKEQAHAKYIAERDAKEQREKTLTDVRKRVTGAITALKPILPEDPKKAANQLRSVLSSIEEYGFEPDGDDYFILDKEGQRVEGPNGHPLKLDDFAKSKAEDFFDFQVSDKKSAAGDFTKGTVKPIKLQKPATRAAYAEKLAEISDDKTIPATDKVKMLGELKELAKDLV
jgi:hypothetical protein